ncbi:tetratricopeptide repeat protein 19, mitochondrial isoform X3 [Lepisosteus oculatus]|uniref:tetratricopeptide repeat protein 19, mitochondrial isoform X3 n=1 Tax=Lepisosteus oculatus TaxID=7918 RepID=UPI003718447C
MFLSRVSRLFQVQAARARRWALDWTRTQGARFRVSVERRAPNRQDRFLSLAAPTQYRRSYTLCTTGIGAKTASDDSLTLQIWGILAFSLFTQSSDNVEDEEKKKEDDIILLLKRAKLSIMQGELEAANRILHQAIRLAHQAKNTQAITYTYSMMANLALVQGQFPEAEKLFKAAMSFLLASGAQEDDNAVIEMSLKLASIYASQNKPELAEHGFEFCAESLEAKIEKQKDLPEGTLPAHRGGEEQHTPSLGPVSGLIRTLPHYKAPAGSGPPEVPSRPADLPRGAGGGTPSDCCADE